MYFGKIHHERKKDSKNEFNHHCHVIVSRKTNDGKVRISPMTNHINTKDGAVKGGFSRKEFYQNAEKSFDNKFIYPRDFQETFEFNNGIKKGNPDEIKQLIEDQFANKGKSDRQLQVISNTLQSINLDRKIVDEIMTGAQYSFEGVYKIKNSNENLIFKKDDVYISLVENQFELMVGNEKFSTWLEQFRANMTNLNQEDNLQERRKRKLSR